MILNAKSNVVDVDNIQMDYVTFGRGKDIIILIPGLGESIATFKGKSLMIALPYREIAKKFRVYIFSRKKILPAEYSTRSMARDLVKAMKALGIKSANIVGVSQGGMIAQYIAIDFPSYVKKLVLTVTLSKPNETVESVINNWISLAYKEDYRSILIDTSEKTYTSRKLKFYRFLYPIVTRIGKPKSFSRFITQANSCITHNSYNELDKIKAETLIISGGADKIVGQSSSKEIAEKIKNNSHKIYESLGHGLYEEAKDFQNILIEFLRENQACCINEETNED